MPRTAPAEWLPVGINDLEPVAWDALRHDASACVVAGPGAGKTEFLAQRACYLLETGICPPPKEILAISFKRDAAANLARRVKTRAGDDSARFVSMTFDAFTKSIVDRFRASLPEYWNMRGTYEIAFPARDEIASYAPEMTIVDLPSFRADSGAALQPDADEGLGAVLPRHPGKQQRRVGR